MEAKKRMQEEETSQSSGLGILRSVGGRIYAVVALAILMLVIIIAITSFVVTQTITTFNRLGTLRTPTVLTSTEAQTDMLTMLINIRGYLSLGDPVFLVNYDAALSNFEGNIAELNTLSVDWTNSENVTRLTNMEAVFATWVLLPPQMFDLRDDPIANQPAQALLVTEGAPRIASVQASITTMIDINALLEPSVINQALSKDMADFRGSWNAMAAGIRGYLANTNPVFLSEYEAALLINDAAWSSLSNQSRSRFTSEQRTALDNIAEAREEFLVFPQQMFDAATGEHAREDLFLLGDEAVPQAGQILDILTVLVADQEALLTNDIVSGQLTLNTSLLVILLISLAAVILIFAISYIIIRSITRPLGIVTNAAQSIAGGDRKQRVDVTSQDELGELASSFNTMTRELDLLYDDMDRRIEARTSDMQTANDVGRLVTGIETQQELLKAVTDYILNSYELYYTQIYLLDVAGRYAILRSGTGDAGKTLMDRGHKLSMDQTSLVARAVQSRRSILVADTEADVTHRANELLPDTRSELAIPLIAGRDVLGVLDMQAVTGGRFNEENLPVFETMAGQLASAIRRTQSYAEIQEAIERSELVTSRLTEEAWSGYLAQLQGGQKLGYQYNLEKPIPLGSEEYVEFVASDEDEVVTASISLRGKQIGTIQVGDDRVHEWHESERALITDVSDRVALALEQFRAFDEVDRRAAELETVARVGLEATTNLDLDEVLGTACDLTKENFGLYHAHIYLLDATGRRMNLAAGAGEVGQRMVANKHHIALNSENSMVARAARSLEGVTENDITLAPDFLPNPLLRETRSELAIPMVVGEEIIGVLDVQSEHIGRFGDEDVRVLGVLASQLAVAVKNARLFKEIEDIRYALDQHAIVAITDQRGIINYVNDKFCEIAKYEREELIGEDHRILNSGYHTKEFMKDLWTTIANGNVWESEVKNKAKDDSFYWVQTTIVPFLNAEGKPYQYIAIRADITEQKGQQDQIRQRAAELETVARVSAATTTLLDVHELLQSVADLTKENFNFYHAHIYLYDEEENTLSLTAGAGDVGRTMIERGHEMSMNRQTGLVTRAARSQEAVIVNNVTAVGDYLPNPLLPDTRSEMAIPMVIGNDLIGVIDIQSVEINRFSEDDIRIHTALSDQIAVAVRNAQAFERERKTIERLKEVDRLKQEFLANMSHELRTPLNSIIGYSEVLLDGVDGDLTDDAVEDVEAIYGSGKHLLNIINEILDLAKIDAGQMRLSTQEKDIIEILQHVVTSSQVLVKDKPVQIVLEEITPVETAHIDPVRMNQIMLNLIGNAIKFTEEGDISVRYGMTDDDMIRVEVADTGAGMTADQLDLIFQRFRQVDGSSTRRAGGTGLGLTITKQLVEMHGGEIGVDSDVGYGTTFWFVLPTSEAFIRLQMDDTGNDDAGTMRQAGD